MIKHYLKVAVRRLKSQKGITSLNILGLSISLSCVILIFLWVKDEISYERCFSNADRIHQAYLKGTETNDVSYQPEVSPKIAGILKQEFPEVINVSRLAPLGEVVIKYNDKIIVDNLSGAADPAYFDIFNYTFVQGNPSQALVQPNSIVLTKSFANRFFNTDPIGKVLTINNKYTFTVTAIIEDLPKNSYRKFNFLVPFGFLKELGQNIEGEEFFPCSYLTYTLLQEKVNLDNLNRKVEKRLNFKNESIKFEISLRPIKDSYLIETGGTSKVLIFSAIALLILALACANYINFSIGLALSKIKEVGVRKISGAFNGQLFMQNFTESFISVTIAIVTATIFSWILVPYFNFLVDKQLSINLLNPFLIIALVSIVIIVGALIALYPSMFISSFKTADSLKNMPSGKISRQLIRKSLIVFQFVITISFIISTIVLVKQDKMVKNFNYGFNKDNILYIKLEGEIKNKTQIVKEKLLTNSNVTSVSVASYLPNDINSGSYWTWGIEEKKSQRICELKVDNDFLKTFGFEMAEGRFYSQDIPSDQQNAVVVNEAAIAQLREKSPTGKTFYFNGEHFTLIGVMKNFQSLSPLSNMFNPVIFRLRPGDNEYLFVKVNPQLKDIISIRQTVNFIHSTCDSYSPDRPLRYMYLSDFSPEIERSLKSRSILIYISTIVAILISCFGLIGLIFLSLNQKIKEIGIRKVNGARVSEILVLLNREYIKWIAIAFLISCPVVYYFLNMWLENFAYHTGLSWWIFILAGTLAVIISFITVSWQSWRAVTRNPVEALRYE